LRSSRLRRRQPALLDRIPEKCESRVRQVDAGKSANGWVRLMLGDVVPSVRYGISAPLVDDAEGTPVLRMNNVGEGKAGHGEIKYTTESVPSDLVLRFGDVLFNRTNSIEQIGRSGLWRDEVPGATFASYLVRLNLDPGQILPQYLALWLSHPEVRHRVRTISTPAVQQVNVNPTKLLKLEIDLPCDLEDQRRICARLDAADDRMACERSALMKLRLLKKGLMDDLLSGKVQVGELSG
jgi:type I restriction enzyme S subunit